MRSSCKSVLTSGASVANLQELLCVVGRVERECCGEDLLEEQEVLMEGGLLAEEQKAGLLRRLVGDGD